MARLCWNYSKGRYEPCQGRTGSKEKARKKSRRHLFHVTGRYAYARRGVQLNRAVPITRAVTVPHPKYAIGPASNFRYSRYRADPTRMFRGSYYHKGRIRPRIHSFWRFWR